LGNHVIKTWSATQGAVALSSAEAEFYAVIEGVTRAKGLTSLCRELGYGNLSDMCKCNIDSSAAKSFINRRGLGKMRHIDIRDLWLQKEAREGRLLMSKVPGEENPADLMTKILNKSEICERLRGMGIAVVLNNVCVGAVRLGDKQFRASELLNFNQGNGSDRNGSELPGGSIEYINEAMAAIVESVGMQRRRGDVKGKSIANRLKQNISELINVCSRGSRH